MDSIDEMASDMNLVDNQKRLEVYHVEYASAEASVKLPYSFSNRFYDSVPTKVMLTDPAGNKNSVSVVKTGNRLYFAEGWKQVGNFYVLGHGGWFLMKYTSFGNFSIEVENLFGDKIKYPAVDNQSVKNDYSNPIVIDADDDEGLENVDSSSFIVDRSKFITAVKKWLSFDEITGHHLAFSKNWCQYALPKKDGPLTIVDEYGNAWDCYYKTVLPGENVSGLVRGLKKFCTQKKLYQGQGASFVVVSPNSNVLYFTFSA